jgi:hypothetical protein
MTPPLSLLNQSYLDVEFREQWNRQFKPNSGVRPVMHDNTNVPMRNPSDADLNRPLYSKDYGQCCAKGGVSVQLCGWIRNIELCTGGIDDSGYIEVGGC